MSGLRVERVPEVLLEAVGDGWAAYSPVAGSTHLLNDSGAAVLDILADNGDMDAYQVASVMAQDLGLPPEDIHQTLQPLWAELERAGLVRRGGGAALA